jgi:long-chain acyl-CoA synthetase
MKSKINNISELVKIDSDKRNNLLALQDLYNEKEHYTYEQLSNKIDEVAGILTKLGIKKGDRCSIFSYNCPKWVIADLAIQKIGAVCVPIYWRASRKDIKFIVEKVKPKLIFVGDSFLNKLLLKSLNKLPQRVLFTEKSHGTVLGWPAFCKLPLSYLTRVIKGKDLAKIVFTSGSTGLPKGVMLNHASLIYEAQKLKEAFKVSEKDRFISYLPLNHMFGLTGEVYSALCGGAEIHFSHHPKETFSLLEKVKPTMMLTVPFILEKIFKKSLNKVAFLGVQNTFSTLNEREPGLIYRFFLHKIGASIYKKMGGRLRCLIVGGAHLGKDVETFFKHSHLPIYQGYGMTEAAPVIAVNSPEHNKLYSVGSLLDLVKISKDGEILVKGPNVMRGYYHDKKRTSSVLKRGWLHTGDLGHLDHYGHLYVEERKDDLIILSTGKNVNPLPLEEKTEELQEVFKSVIFGNHKPYVVGLFFVNGDVSSGLIKKISKEIEKINTHLPHYERIGNFKLLPGKELQQSKAMKISRKALILDNVEEIKKLYLK